MNKFLVFAVLVMAIGLLFSCTTDIESAEEVLGKADSSSSYDEPGGSFLSGSVFCQFPDNTCRQYSEKACLVFGQVVESCPEIGSSSSSVADVSSNSSVVPSSSSVLPSSSSTAPSSSSVVSSSSSALLSSSSIVPSSSSATLPSSPSEGLCAGFVEGTEREHYGKMKKQFCDERDGKKYVYVVIGTQTWMAENLNFNADGSKCYNNLNFNCNSLYGRMYNWATAMDLPSSCNLDSCSSQIQTKHKGICPDGWHISSQAEWNTLSSYVRCSDCDAKLLKAASEWNKKLNGSSGSGTDQYGFSALPGGYVYSSGGFDNVDKHGEWWSTNEHDKNNNKAYYRAMFYDYDYAYWDSFEDKSGLRSVRCVQD